jgi:hypothetical protein
VDALFDAPGEVAAPVRILEESVAQLELRALRAESDDLDVAIARADGPQKDQLIEQKRRIARRSGAAAARGSAGTASSGAAMRDADAARARARLFAPGRANTLSA